MAAEALDEVGAPDDDAGLGPTQELVAGERDEVRSGTEAPASRTPEPRSSTSTSPPRSARRARSFKAGCSAKPTMRKFDWCTRRIAAVSSRTARS
jgi:hypothetical protein